jgi:hypothetical protein
MSTSTLVTFMGAAGCRVGILPILPTGKNRVCQEAQKHPPVLTD